VRCELPEAESKLQERNAVHDFTERCTLQEAEEDSVDAVHDLSECCTLQEAKAKKISMDSAIMPAAKGGKKKTSFDVPELDSPVRVMRGAASSFFASCGA